MHTESAIEFGQEAVLTCLTLAAPILIVGIAVAIVLGILQSMTQIQDQTVSFVPKIILIAISFMICLPWCTERIVEYSRDQFSHPKFVKPMGSEPLPEEMSIPPNRTASSNSIPFVGDRETR